MSCPFAFNETLYCSRPGAPGSFPPAEREELATLKRNHPELQAWGDLAVYVAWSAYSETVRLVGWVEDLARNEEFLNFLCWEQTRGQWSWGSAPDALRQVRDVWDAVAA